MKRKDISCFDDILDKKYGRVGTEERKAFREEAVKHCALTNKSSFK